MREIVYAIDVLEANRSEYDFDEGMKRKCLTFIQRTAEAFDGVCLEERVLIERLEKDFSRF
jgi:hypothetical protein